MNDIFFTLFLAKDEISRPLFKLCKKQIETDI